MVKVQFKHTLYSVHTCTIILYWKDVLTVNGKKIESKRLQSMCLHFLSKKLLTSASSFKHGYQVH